MALARHSHWHQIWAPSLHWAWVYFQCKAVAKYSSSSKTDTPKIDAFLKFRAQLKFVNLWPRAVCQCKGLVTRLLWQDSCQYLNLRQWNPSSVTRNNSCWGNHRKHLLNMKESWSSKNYSTKSCWKSNWLLFWLNMKNDLKMNPNQMTKSESWFSF